MAKRLFVAPSPISHVKDVEDVVVRDVSLHAYLLSAVADAMKADGYGLRSRSRWLEEAFAGMVVNDPLMMEGSTGDKAVDGPEGKLERTKVQIRRSMARQLDALSARLRRENPFMEGAMSYVMRSAARYRLRFPHLYHFGTKEELQQLFQKAVDVDFSAE